MKLLPGDCFTPLPNPHLPPPLDEDKLLPAATVPFLRVIDDDEPEPPEAA